MDERNLTFAEKHPRLNLLIGFLLLVLIASFALAFLSRTLDFIAASVISFIQSLSQIVDKLDAVIIVALITGGVSILSIILSSIVAKSLEYRRARREYLTLKREVPYGEFIDMVYKLNQSMKPEHEYPQEEMIKDIMDFSKKITLWGSPKVVKDWSKFKENALKSNTAFENIMLTEKIMNDMRKDLGMKRVKKGDLLSFYINDIKEAMKKDSKKRRNSK